MSPDTLPRRTTTLRRCIKNANERVSAVVAVIYTTTTTTTTNNNNKYKNCESVKLVLFSFEHNINAVQRFTAVDVY